VGIEADAVLRLLVAAGLGALIGIERESTEQPAGLRTHIAVSVGAALFGVISTLGFSEFVAVRADTNVQIDVTRVASQVVVGIGFLGAGVIFRQGVSVRNLTTAASLWVTAAIGLASGVGDVGTAAVATAIMLASLVVLLPIRTFIRQRLAREERVVRIVVERGVAADGLLAALDELDGVRVERLAIDKLDGQLAVVTKLVGDRGVRLHDQLRAISGRDDVRTLTDAD
jgi:putative Mg2+ transporter-C (MgtC) family protein